MSGDPYFSDIVGADAERLVNGAFTGSFQTLGSVLTVNPIIMIFDNQSTVSIAVSFDGVNTWKTFVAGEALVLDLKANHGNAKTWTFLQGTQVWIKGTGGTGGFSLAILYGRS